MYPLYNLFITQTRRLRLSTMKKCSVGAESSDTPIGLNRQRALTMDEVSLLLSDRNRGIFLSRSISIVSCPALRSNAAIWVSYSEIVVAAASSAFSSPDHIGSATTE